MSEKKKKGFFEKLFTGKETKAEQTAEPKQVLTATAAEKKTIRNLNLLQAFRTLDEHPPVINKPEGTITIGIIGSNENAFCFMQAAASLLQVDSCRLIIHLALDDNEKFLKKLLKEAPESAEAFEVIDSYNIIDPRFALNHKLLNDVIAELHLHGKKEEASWAEDIPNIYLMNKFAEDSVSIAETLLNQKEHVIGILTDDVHQKLVNALARRHRDYNLYAIKENPDTKSSDKEWKSEVERKGFIIHSEYTRAMDPHASESSMRQQYLNSDKKKKYNRFSSIRTALSIRYKIASLHAGFILDDEDAAVKFEEISSSPEISTKLMNLEHRCWEIFQIMTGWVSVDYAIQNIEQYKDKTAEQALIFMYQESRRFRDDSRKVHPCLVESHTEDKVKEYGHDAKSWKKKAGMDQLDQMSVLMFKALQQVCRDEKEERDHRYKTCLDKLKKNKSIENEIALLTAGHERIDENNSEAAFLWNRGTDAVKPYLTPKEAKELSYCFKPLLDLLEYRSYKEADEVVTKAFSRIISSFDAETIYRPYISDTDTHSMYKNLIGTLVYEPEHLVLVHINGKKPDVKAIEKTLMHAGRDCVKVSTMEVSSFARKKKAAHAAVDLTGLSLAQFAFFQNEADKALSFMNYFAVERGNVVDARTWKKIFSSQIALNINDMISLAGGQMSSLTQYNPIMGIDDVSIRNLLDLSLKKPYGWTLLCKLLGKYTKDTKDSRVAKLNFGASKPRHYVLQKDGMMQGLDIDELKAFMDDLAGQKLIEPSYKIPDAYDPSISFTTKYQSVYEGLKKFLIDSDYQGRHRLQLTKTDGGKYHIHDDRLDIHAEYSSADAMQVLNGIKGDNGAKVDINTIYSKACSELHFIFGKTDADGYHAESESVVAADGTKLRECCSIGTSSLFTKPPVFRTGKGKTVLDISYADDAVKDLFSKEGNVLELFLYRLFARKHIFDDVQVSVELNWKNEIRTENSVWNEIDVIGIKGVETYLISCKKTNQVEKQFLEEIKVETDRFGINGHAVLASTTDKVSQTLQNRAKELGIRLIYGSMMMQNEDAIADMFRKFIEEDRNAGKDKPLF